MDAGNYRRHPQLDIQRAAASLRAAEAVLSRHPAAGKRFEDFDTVREHRIQGTSFALLCTVARDTVWIIDVRDQRSRPRVGGWFQLNVPVRPVAHHLRDADRPGFV